MILSILYRIHIFSLYEQNLHGAHVLSFSNEYCHSFLPLFSL